MEYRFGDTEKYLEYSYLNKPEIEAKVVTEYHDKTPAPYYGNLSVGNSQLAQSLRSIRKTVANDVQQNLAQLKASANRAKVSSSQTKNNAKTKALIQGLALGFGGIVGLIAGLYIFGKKKKKSNSDSNEDKVSGSDNLPSQNGVKPTDKLESVSITYDNGGVETGAYYLVDKTTGKTISMGGGGFEEELSQYENGYSEDMRDSIIQGISEKGKYENPTHSEGYADGGLGIVGGFVTQSEVNHSLNTEVSHESGEEYLEALEKEEKEQQAAEALKEKQEESGKDRSGTSSEDFGGN